MADEERSNLPARVTLDRAALERVLGRAAELAVSSPESIEMLTEERVIEVGKEVGIPEHLVRQALAEERTRAVVPVEPGIVAQYFGAARASASRIVPGTAESVLTALDRWMQREECLQVKRRFPDRMTWEARRDFLGNVKRGFNLGGRGYALTGAAEVGATVVAVDTNRVLLRLDADLEPPRRTTVSWTTATASLGAAGGAGLAGLAMLLNIALPVAIVAGGATALVGMAGAAGIARMHRKLVTRAQLALDQILDEMEHGQPQPPSHGPLLDKINAVVKAIR